jgi:hypothetical protein
METGEDENSSILRLRWASSELGLERKSRFLRDLNVIRYGKAGVVRKDISEHYVTVEAFHSHDP